MNKIFKYIMAITDSQGIVMPRLHTVRHVAFQAGVLCVWAEHREPVEAKDKAVVNFRIVGTGHPIEDPESLEFVGTVQDQKLQLVWHVFKEKN